MAVMDGIGKKHTLSVLLLAGLFLLGLLLLWQWQLRWEQLQTIRQHSAQQTMKAQLMEQERLRLASDTDPDWQRFAQLARQRAQPWAQWLPLYLAYLRPGQPRAIAPVPLPLPQPVQDPALERRQRALEKTLGDQRRRLSEQQAQLARLNHQLQRQAALWQQWTDDQKRYSQDVSLVPLFVETTPANAKIEVLNISPRYSQGLTLPSGRYLIRVSATGFNTVNRWVDLQPLANRFCIGLRDASEGPAPGEHQGTVLEPTCAGL
ncbi:hypothetical protein [Ferrimonas sp. YFM]|uniref:hypothetical protein n=1 Tax=Ferrimonas sp. YFM TaxID=3028878 RepID=UPI002572A192|nr:hypothetical protein [Ferrimonas sp. YFM]BDY03419.1 hypothetical protein F0521_04600 [Ferrimonas sp. YFM]